MAKAAKKTVRAEKKTKTTGEETNIVRRVSLRGKKAPAAGKFAPGDTVNVHVKVKEGEKERVQVYKGIVIRLQGAGSARSFTVRKISAGVGVERTFPFLSPALDKVELLATGKVRRAKLYYLRGLDGKAAKIESELAVQKSATAETETTSK